MSTLALNIIVGPNESKLLKRCLDSYDAKNNFDEIVIINTSIDGDVDSMAKQYTDKMYHFQWESEEYPFGNFGGARNMAIDNTDSDKIWWLDTDDVCLDKYKSALSASIKLIKSEDYRDVMIWRMPYTIILNDKWEPDLWFKRERVFDRRTIRWRKSVHELLFPGIELVKHASINNMYNTHLPMKPTFVSAQRNIKMLEFELTLDSDDIPTRYFLGREYMHIGETRKGIECLDGILFEMSASSEMLFAIAMDLAWFYSYGCITPHPSIDNFKKENAMKAESYCRLAMAISDAYAEPCVLLGDVYVNKNAFDSAMKMYHVAMKKRIGTGNFQVQPLYCEIPSDRLSRIYEARNMLGMSVHYNDMAKKAGLTDEYVERKKKLVNKLIVEVNDECTNQSS